MAEKDAVRVSDLAEQMHMGVRQYERRFADQIGLSPKLFARNNEFPSLADSENSSEFNSAGRGHLLDIPPSFVILLRRFQMFQHQRSVNR